MECDGSFLAGDMPKRWPTVQAGSRLHLSPMPHTQTHPMPSNLQRWGPLTTVFFMPAKGGQSGSATKGSTTNTDTVAVHFSSMESLIEKLTKSFSTSPAPFKSVLVKGSRFMKMEQSVHALELLQDSLLQNNNVQVSAQNKESTCC